MLLNLKKREKNHALGLLNSKNTFERGKLFPINLLKYTFIIALYSYWFS